MSAWTRTRPLLSWIPIVIAAPLLILAWRGPSASGDGSLDRIARGEYLVATIGCDDCRSASSAAETVTIVSSVKAVADAISP